MKKYLYISLAIMAATMILMAVSDQLFQTSYTGATTFQPFPHLLLLLSCAASCYCGYRVRNEGRKTDEISYFSKIINKLLRHLAECFLLVAIGLVCMKLFGMDV